MKIIVLFKVIFISFKLCFTVQQWKTEEMEHSHTATTEAGSDYADIQYDDDDYHQEEDAQNLTQKVEERDLRIFVPHDSFWRI